MEYPARYHSLLLPAIPLAQSDTISYFYTCSYADNINHFIIEPPNYDEILSFESAEWFILIILLLMNYSYLSDLAVVTSSELYCGCHEMSFEG
jgi:hypothetical protein